MLVQLVGPTAGDNKNSVGLEFTAPSLAATVEVWDSGECEVIASEMDDPEGDPAVSVLELADPNEVGDVLAHVVAQLAAQ
ncbi:hypothetical protein GXB85_11165 [Cellulomonas sp. APG4]|uniref:hypothetical protein n=1 Tax=Cellulomonas sp. APG4 TaxID=1538656 RepID=UPI00137B7251|nr:hypothetical protein [Cellulomonas sp. APG4]NCT91506.1 hypothetical protein [Cellulomonas sp. APG4]